MIRNDSAEPTRVTISLPRQQAERLRSRAIAEDRSISAVIRRALDSTLDDNPEVDSR